jgi:hypothetical protein
MMDESVIGVSSLTSATLGSSLAGGQAEKRHFTH